MEGSWPKVENVFTESVFLKDCCCLNLCDREECICEPWVLGIKLKELVFAY